MKYESDVFLKQLDSLLAWIAWTGLQAFFCALAIVCGPHAKTLFWQEHARSHRLVGGILYVWLWIRAFQCHPQGAVVVHRTEALVDEMTLFLLDLITAALGLTATLTAARDFPHKRIRKDLTGQHSGTLGSEAIVTQAEMVEHAFYQGLNMVQACYLYGMRLLMLHYHESPTRRKIFSIVGLKLVTAPWWFRRSFPVHSFRDNWKKVPKAKQSSLEALLYQIKKVQYLFYKHVILHGLNLTVATHCMTGSSDLDDVVGEEAWHFFWICLIGSYVMEFFLQTLVKRGVLTQGHMLLLNRWLMGVASLAAARVLTQVSWPLAGLSCLLNFIHPRAEVQNTVGLALTVVLVSQVASVEQT